MNHRLVCEHCGCKNEDISKLNLDCELEYEMSGYEICWNVHKSYGDILQDWKNWGYLTEEEYRKRHDKVSSCGFKLSE